MYNPKRSEGSTEPCDLLNPIYELSNQCITCLDHCKQVVKSYVYYMRNLRVS